MAKESFEEYRQKETKVRKSLWYSIIDGSAYSAMLGFGNNFLSAFAIALKASPTVLGMIATLPELIGALFQLSVNKLMESFSRKRIIVLGALLHALTWLPILLIPYFAKENGALFLLAFVCLNSVFSAILSPVWNSLMGDLVPEDERGRYFGRRNRITGITTFISTFIAGYTLHLFDIFNPFLGFAVLFSIALVFRLISTFYLSKMHEPEFKVDKSSHFTFRDFIARMKRNDNHYGHFAIYLCIIGFAVAIAAPFYALYMLRDLHFSYLQFTIISMASIISSFMAMGFWGKFGDKFGNKKVLIIAGFLIPFGALLWTLSGNFYYLFIVEFYSGVVWAGFNLSAANYIFDATTPQKRTRCIVYYNLIHGIAVFFGALAGGQLLNYMGNWIFISNVPILFLISGILRMLSIMTFYPKLREMRLIEVPFGHSFFKKFVAVKPSQGIIYETIGTYPKKTIRTIISEKKEEKKRPEPQQTRIIEEEKRKLLKQYFDTVEKEKG